jgi:hypothetical protein
MQVFTNQARGSQAAGFFLRMHRGLPTCGPARNPDAGGPGSLNLRVTISETGDSAGARPGVGVYELLRFPLPTWAGLAGLSGAQGPRSAGFSRSGRCVSSAVISNFRGMASEGPITTMRSAGARFTHQLQGESGALPVHREGNNKGKDVHFLSGVLPWPLTITSAASAGTRSK